MEVDARHAKIPVRDIHDTVLLCNHLMLSDYISSLSRSYEKATSMNADGSGHCVMGMETLDVPALELDYHVGWC